MDFTGGWEFWSFFPSKDDAGGSLVKREGSYLLFVHRTVIVLEWDGTGEGGRETAGWRMLPRTSYSETVASDIFQTVCVLGCSLKHQ